jgi:hypothetical protein
VSAALKELKPPDPLTGLTQRNPMVRKALYSLVTAAQTCGCAADEKPVRKLAAPLRTVKGPHFPDFAHPVVCVRPCQSADKPVVVSARSSKNSRLKSFPHRPCDMEATTNASNDTNDDLDSSRSTSCGFFNDSRFFAFWKFQPGLQKTGTLIDTDKH